MKPKSTYEWHKYWAEIAAKRVHDVYGVESGFILHLIFLLTKDLNKKDKRTLLNQLLCER